MKTKTSYVCNKCQYSSPTWAGQCPQCEEWNTFEEQIQQSKKSQGVKAAPTKTTPIKDFIQNSQKRLQTGIQELYRTLSGGFLNSSFTLLTGEP